MDAVQYKRENRAVERAAREMAKATVAARSAFLSLSVLARSAEVEQLRQQVNTVSLDAQGAFNTLNDWIRQSNPPA